MNQEWKNLVRNRKCKLGVIGIGYVGLPLSVTFASAGFSVLAIDVLEDKVKAVNQGKSPIKDVTDDQIEALIRENRLRASTNYQDLSDCHAISICVPTPLRKTKDPDISFILDASYRIAEVVQKGSLVILESTTYPGTTHERILPIFQEKNMECGKDFFLAYSPERIDPGNKTYTVKNTPKVVGGLDEASREMAAELYGSIISEIVRVSSTQSAEMVKLLENTFRAVNIGLVNEIAIMCRKLNINTWEVIEAAASKPFGFMPFYPGPGLGGHCIPVDPHYLNWKLKTLNYNARFIELAGDINSSMPQLVVDMVTGALNQNKKSVNGSKILVLGVAYKADVDDVRESPALDILGLLRDRGGEMSYYDPFVPSIRFGDGPLKSLLKQEMENGSIQNFDCVVITTHHTQFNIPSIVEHAQLLVDTRNATKGLPCGEGKLFRL